MGEDGINLSLIRTSIETSNANCADGGIEFPTRFDENRNGLLDEEEIKQQQFMCGLATPKAIRYQSIVLTDLSLPPAALMCDAGEGCNIYYGYDDGDGGGVSANGILETGEVDSSVTYCLDSTGLVADISTSSGSPTEQQSQEIKCTSRNGGHVRIRASG